MREPYIKTATIIVPLKNTVDVELTLTMHIRNLPVRAVAHTIYKTLDDVAKEIISKEPPI